MNSAASNPKTFPLSRVNGIVHVRLFKRTLQIEGGIEVLMKKEKKEKNMGVEKKNGEVLVRNKI